MFENALDFAVLALTQAHRQPAIGALRSVKRRLDPGIMNAVERKAFGEPVEARLIRFAVGSDAIAPKPAGRRKFEHARKPAIICEKDQPLRIDIEPADTDEAWRLGVVPLQIIEDRWPPLRVLVGGDKAARLMEQEELRALTLRQGLAIDADLIVPADGHGRCG